VTRTLRSWAPALPLAFVGILAAWTPTGTGVTLCPFALLTGHACPGCGMTRAVISLLNGHWVQALRFHPLAPVLVAGVIVGFGWWLGSKRLRWPPLPMRMLNAALVSFGVMLVVVWIARFAGGTLPPV
jgi:hypothetical protein